MTRRNDERLTDILDAASAISGHVARGGLDDGMVFDAVRVRLIEIGEAVKAIDPGLPALVAATERLRDAGDAPAEQ